MKFRLPHLLAGAIVAMSAGDAAWAHGQAHAGRASAAAAPEQKPWGIAAKAFQRTIEVRMTDNMRFSPDRIRVRQGETVRFVVRNNGKMLHEMVIGTKEALDEHAAMMLKFPTMEHDEPDMTHVNPGKDGRIVWNFNRPGEFQFACLVAGHYQAGMVGTISVIPAKKSTQRK
ncbi:MAG TPA: cupredoxin family protein [Ramlibacter sp.]|nr:cupredoxin family protein [Ramlibacter sp.]